MISTVPDVLDYLTGTLLPLLPDLQVLDGMQTVDPEPSTLIVGYSGEDGSQPAVTGEWLASGLSSGSRRSTYEVLCLLSLWTGDERDVGGLRRRAYAYLDAVDGLLRGDNRLGGLVLSAQLGRQEMTPLQTEDGSAVAVAFTVRVTADAGR